MANKKIALPLTKESIEEMADEICKLLTKNGIWSDTRIYFNGEMIDNKDESGAYHYDGSVYHHEDVDPSQYFEYVNPDHILSMSFEGPVYHMFNYGSYPDIMKKLNKLFSKYGVYYELGNAWNLTCYYA